MKLYSAYIFDLDGTLIDSREDLATTINYMRQTLNLPALPLNTIISYIGGGSLELVKLSLQDSHHGYKKAHQVAMNYYFNHCCIKTKFYPKVLKTLQRLKKQNFKLAISTNKPEKYAKEIIKQLKR